MKNVFYFVLIIFLLVLIIGVQWMKHTNFTPKELPNRDEGTTEVIIPEVETSTTTEGTMELVVYLQDKGAAAHYDCRITTPVHIQVPKTTAVAAASLRYLFSSELAAFGDFVDITIIDAVARVVIEPLSTTGPDWGASLSSCEAGHLVSVIHDTLTQYESVNSIELYTPAGPVTF